MFKSARIRLTGLYIIIVTFVGIIFSSIIYRDFVMELHKNYAAAEYRLHNQITISPPRRAVVISLLAEDFEKSKKIVFLRLLAINGFVISVSGIAAYFLAGKTLQPIELAVEDQKRFVSDASHELRTPLTSMKSEIEVALRDKKMTVKDNKKLLSSNLEEVDKMQKLTNYLLALNRYESGNFKLTKEKINIANLAEKIIKNNQKKAEKRAIQLTSKLKEANIYANQTSIEELISILIDNAIKYTPPKGKIKVTVKTLKRNTVIEIADNGIGIKASEIPYIFNRFYRADSARSKHTTEGYGLGLSIAKSIVDLHHSQICVKSTPGIGTTFTVTLK